MDLLNLMNFFIFGFTLKHFVAERCSMNKIIFRLIIIGKKSLVLTDLTNHDRKSKDANKVVDELEADLKDSGGIWQTPNGDQRLHSEVITTDVAVWKKHKHVHISKLTLNPVTIQD